MPNILIDITGQRFGRLIVLKRADAAHHQKPRWLCRCDCGALKTVLGSNLKQRATESCGCWRDEFASLRAKRHGQSGKSKTDEYTTWINMKDRCYNPRCVGFKYYGGRGIAVCDKWHDSFENFFADMGPKPEGMTLDRIRVGEGYSKDNCRWATPKQQSLNKRNSLLVEINGEQKSAQECSETFGLRYSTLRKRLNRGWPVEKAIHHPVRDWGRG